MPEIEAGQGPISGIGTTGPAPAAAGQAEPEPASTEGQAATTEGQTQGQTKGKPEGQPAAGTKTEPVRAQTETGAEEPTFFDPSTLPDELIPAYKQMQSAFTKKSTALKARAQDLEIIDTFRRDPLGTLTSVARQHGLQIVDPRQQGGGPSGNMSGSQGNPLSDPNWEPKNYQELGDAITNRAVTAILDRITPLLQPLAQNVERISSTHIEQQLDGIDSNWRLYEDDIKANMTQHPTLLKDPDGINKLYRLSVPEDVYRSRAVQEVMKKQEGKVQSLKMGSKSTTTHAAPAPKGVNSFADAVAAAREQLTGR